VTVTVLLTMTCDLVDFFQWEAGVTQVEELPRYKG